MEAGLSTLALFGHAMWPFVKFGLWVLFGLILFAIVVGWLQRRGPA